jgi:polyhydroxyalkanoate synthesis regulator phasin
MEDMDNYLRKILVAGVGAAELSYEKMGEIINECVKRGEVTVERGRALNEELKHKCKEAVSPDGEKGADFDVEKLTADERARLLEKLLAMQEDKK